MVGMITIDMFILFHNIQLVQIYVLNYIIFMVRRKWLLPESCLSASSFSSSPGKAPLQRHGPPYLVLLGLGCGWPCRQGARAKETSAVHDCQRNSYDMEQLRVLQMWRLMRGAKGILVHLQHWSIMRMPDMPWHQCDCKPTRKWRQQSTAWRWTEWSKDQCPGGRTKPSEFYARKWRHLGQRIYSRYQPPLLPLVKKQVVLECYSWAFYARVYNIITIMESLKLSFR